MSLIECSVFKVDENFSTLNKKESYEFKEINFNSYVVGINNVFVRFDGNDGYGINLPENDLKWNYFRVSEQSSQILIPYSIKIVKYDEGDGDFSYENLNVHYNEDKMQLYLDFSSAVVLQELSQLEKSFSAEIFKNFNFFRKLLFKSDLNDLLNSLYSETEIIEKYKNETFEYIQKLVTQLSEIKNFYIQNLSDTIGIHTNN